MSIPRLPRTASIDEMIFHVHQQGGIIIQGFLSPKDFSSDIPEFENILDAATSEASAKDTKKQRMIQVTLHQGTTAGMRVSLMGATSSTHGNSMGSRTIFPAFTCAGNTCTITAPPNAGVAPPGWFQVFILDGPTPSHSHWVRIGGDPSEMGNWPNLPGFTNPGMGPAVIP